MRETTPPGESADMSRRLVDEIVPTATLLCEQVLEEKDGTLSAIRIIDRVTIDVSPLSDDAPTELPPLPINAVLLLSFKKTLAPERSASVSVTVTSPSGRSTAVASLPLAIQEGEGKGANLILRMGFGASESGWYWFGVALDGRPISRVPLEVLIRRVTASGAPTT